MLEGLQMYWQLKYNTPFKINSNQICKGWIFFEMQEAWRKWWMEKENIEVQEVGKKQI